jgi:hypothetical protein
MTAEQHVAYAMGWATGTFLGERVVFHGGEEPGFNAQVVLLPDRGFGAFIAVNRNSLAPYQLAKAIVAEYLGRSAERDWSVEYVRQIDQWNAAATEAETARETGRLRGVGPSLPLARYAGRFQNELTGTLMITQVGDKLVAELNARERPIVMDLAHWHIAQFTGNYPPYGYRLRFAFDVNEVGEAAGLRVSGFGEFRRVKP